MVNRKELRKKIPKGYCQIIANKAGVTSGSVSLYFSSKINSESIENAALQVVAGLTKTKRKLLNAIYE